MTDVGMHVACCGSLSYVTCAVGLHAYTLGFTVRNTDRCMWVPRGGWHMRVCLTNVRVMYLLVYSLLALRGKE